MNIMEKLAKRISELKNPTVAGLDTRIEYLPENFVREVLPNGIHSFEDAAKAVYAYNVRLIDALCDGCIFTTAPISPVSSSTA